MNIGKSINLGCAHFNKKKGDLAKAIGKSNVTVSLYVSGKANPTVDTIKAMADYFGVKTSKFIEWGEE